ncbi:exported hypothetical protein [Nostocoides japonicum T1-X7]|uniref:DUF222 domain-containing protein n=1 Tax=Nostocoides japonicum T1-X7 TaxID=1194083 RepID=A0A077M277_9MICO|nr:hypothetical protein [Tetrasphaera japonica]CCH78290.1 exported hypothetical protein [Tetrasphaera japonica T1-X7]
MHRHPLIPRTRPGAGSGSTVLTAESAAPGPGAGAGRTTHTVETAYTVEGVLAWLAETDGAALVDGARVELLAGLERVTSGVAAAQARVTVAFADSQLAAAATAGGGQGATASATEDARSALSRARRARVARSIGSQVALARRQSPVKGDRLVGLARALVGELPSTLAALTAGDTTEWRATLVARETTVLDPADRAVADARLGPLLPGLGDAGTERAARQVV